MAERKTAAGKSKESIYTVMELAEYADAVLGPEYKKECVAAAFKRSGLQQATVTQAKELVRNFLKKEVK